jgi:hypothetical protein
MQKRPRENCPKRFLGSCAIRRNIYLSTAGIEIEGCNPRFMSGARRGGFGMRRGVSAAGWRVGRII